LTLLYFKKLDTTIACDSWTQSELYHSLTHVLNEKLDNQLSGTIVGYSVNWALIFYYVSMTVALLLLSWYISIDTWVWGLFWLVYWKPIHGSFHLKIFKFYVEELPFFCNSNNFGKLISKKSCPAHQNSLTM
jgi:hypothetical protein